MGVIRIAVHIYWVTKVYMAAKAPSKGGMARTSATLSHPFPDRWYHMVHIAIQLHVANTMEVVAAVVSAIMFDPFLTEVAGTQRRQRALTENSWPIPALEHRPNKDIRKSLAPQ